VKTTLELPDELVVEIKVEAALRKKKLKELVPELVRAGLRAQREAAAPPPGAARRWLAEWVAEGRDATTSLPPSPTAREILDADRDRLEPSHPEADVSSPMTNLAKERGVQHGRRGRGAPAGRAARGARSPRRKR